MDLTTIAITGIFTVALGITALVAIANYVKRRLIDEIGRFIDGYIANFVNEVATNAEFRSTLTKPFIADIMKEFGVNKAQGGGETLKIGGFKVPMALIEMFMGRAANKGADAVANALPGLLG